MNIKQILLVATVIIVQNYVEASNAFNNDATYYLDRQDDLSPVGNHAQKDDLDVTITSNLLLQAVKDNNYSRVKKLLSDKKNIYSDSDIAQALYYATVNDFDNITELLSKYATTNANKIQ